MPISEPTLAAPGAGVPWWQRRTGKYVLLPLYARRLSWEAARDLLVDEGRALIRRADGIATARLERRVLVPPQIGLEDSLRYWSYAMILEHLWILGRRGADVIVQLTHGRVPPQPLSTADLKPAGGRPVAAAIAELGEFLADYRSRVTDDVRDRRSPARYVHPWFGPPTAHQWIAFMPFHQRIHARQARRILQD